MAQSGAAVQVGCAAGADAQVIRFFVFGLGAAFLSQLSVFAVGGACGSGFPSVSPFSLLQAVASRVRWWAGGSAAVPLRARLIQRSCAAFAGCSAAVFFLSSASSSGSLAVAAQAVKAGLPVFVFSCGFSAAPASLAGQAGQWVPGSFFGFPCWQWQPAAVQISLF